MSFTDIGKILKDADKEKESEQQRTRQELLSSKAYKLFPEASTPEEAAIALNLRQPQVTELYTEHWKLKGLYVLDRIYGQIKDDIGSFVNLYGLAKAAGMNVQHVIRLLAIANNHLLSVEYTYETHKREVEDLEAEKRNSARIYQEINDKILSMRNMLDSLNLERERISTKGSTVSEENETTGSCKTL
jgi:predicted XRE-type DNA-binding protein